MTVAPTFSRPKWSPQGPGEQAVAEADLDDVLLGDANGGDQAGHKVRPVVDVLFCVGPHRGLARGAGAGVDAHDVLHGHGQHAEGVVVPDVVLGGEGDVLDVRQGLDLLPGGDARRPQPLVVEGDVVVAVVHHPAQPLQLQGLDVRPLHGLDVFLEKPGLHGFLSFFPGRPGLSWAGDGFSAAFCALTRKSSSIYFTLFPPFLQGRRGQNSWFLQNFWGLLDCVPGAAALLHWPPALSGAAAPRLPWRPWAPGRPRRRRGRRGRGPAGSACYRPARKSAILWQSQGRWHSNLGPMRRSPPTWWVVTMTRWV